MTPEAAPSLSAKDLEKWFVERIARALAIPPEEVDVNASVTDLGLDSVAALQLTAELEKLVGRPLNATLFFEHRTIARVSRHLASRR